MLAMGLGEASAKVRSGPPLDDEEDYASDAWAGVIPLALTAGTPAADPRLDPGVPPSPCVRRWEPCRRAG